jgi:sugar-specific transcriptional regulator TrmB
MCNRPPKRPRLEAIEQLEALGLSAYAARTFVGLVELGTGTAKSVSNTVDVPRTRVYDAVEELDDCGLVSVEETTPKRFSSVPPERACEVIEREYMGRITELQRSLDALGRTDGPSE